MTVEGILGAGKTTRNLLPAPQSNSGTDFSDILSERSSLQDEIKRMPPKLSDSLRVPHAVVEKRPFCIICGQTISDEGTCLCEYPTVITKGGGINLKHNSAAAGVTAQSEAAVANKANNIIPDDSKPCGTEDIKLRHKCPICGTVSDDGSCSCDTSKSISMKSATHKPVIRTISKLGS